MTLDRIKKTALLCLVLFNFMMVTAYAEPLPDRLIQGLQYLEKTAGFSCEFDQRISFLDGREQYYQGVLAIRRPGSFRWQYTQPYAQLFVSQGQGVWHYEADLMQAEWFANFDAVDPVVMRFLDGRVKVNDVQLLSEGSPREGVHVYHLQIMGSLKMSIALSDRSELRWLESVDVLGNINRIILRDVDKTLPKKQVFEFKVPDHVDVINAPTEGSIN